MPKYAKRSYKRTYRRFKKTNRRARKGRYLSGLKRFARRLNSVAEKKLYTTSTGAAPIISSSSAGLIAVGASLMTSSMPALGSTYTNRIGQRIFVRYVKTTFILYGDATHYTAGWVGILLIKERHPGSLIGKVINTFTHNNSPLVEGNVLKTDASKIRLKKFQMQSIASLSGAGAYQGPPFAKVVSFKFKIMKNATIDNGGFINIPDWYLYPLHFDAPFSYNGAVGPLYFIQHTNITFTDV